MNTLETPWRVLRNAVVNTVNHDGIEHAGYLAFLGLLGLFPFLVFFFALVGFLGEGETGSEFIRLILQNVPNDITKALMPRIMEIISGPPQGLLTVAVLGAIWTASSAVEGLRTILNRAYHVKTPPAYWFRRLMSIAQLLLFTCVLIAGMLVVIFTPLFLRHIESLLGIEFIFAYEQYLSQLIFTGAIIAMFVAISFIYYALPNIKQNLLAVAPGALIVVFLWLAAAYFFTLYLSNFEQVNLIYGSLGGIIAALIFFYICNVIFIFGAELNYQIVHALGKTVEQREEVDEQS
ncbi:MAG: YihY/virulence factor BrkB family protein [Rickettsiales bacterium]